MKNRFTTIVLIAFNAAILFTVGFVMLFGLGSRENNSRPADGSATYRLAELQEDYQQFRGLIETRHPMLYAERGEIVEILDSRYGELYEGMSGFEFYRLLSGIAAELNCGHTNVLPSEAHENYLKREGRFFPMKVRVLDGGLFAESGSGPLPRGTEILRINGREAGSVLEALYGFVPSDGWNKSRKTAIINNQFAMLYATLIDPAESFEVEYRMPGDREATTETLAGVNFDRIMDPDSEIASIGVYLDMEEIRSDFSGKIFDDYALLELGSFILDNKSFAGFLEDFFAQIKEKKIDTLILDLRGNWGGTPKPAAELLQYLIREPVSYFDSEAPFYLWSYKRPMKVAEDAFDGSLYVLMNGSNFSTTGHFLSILKYHGIGSFIGEESGGGAVCTDAKRKKVLPNTRLRFYYSTAAFGTDVAGFTPGRGIMPDREIPLSVDDVVSNTDPVMQAALRAAAEQ